MSDATAVGEIQVNGRQYKVLYDFRRKDFSTTVDGRAVYAKTCDALEADVRRETKRQKIEHHIRVVLMQPSNKAGAARFVRAVLRGQNIRTHEFLFTMEDGSKDQIQHPQLTMLGDEITDADLVALNNLAVQAKEAEQALYNFISKHRKYAPQAWSLIQDAEKLELDSKEEAK